MHLFYHITTLRPYSFCAHRLHFESDKLRKNFLIFVKFLRLPFSYRKFLLTLHQRRKTAGRVTGRVEILQPASQAG